MPIRNFIAVAAFSLIISGCQHLGGESPVKVRQILSEQRQAGCPEQDDSCPLVNIDTQLFENEPVLNALIDQRLREMTVNTPDAQVPPSLEGYQQAFLQDAEPGWISYLQAKLREQHGSMLVVELSSYLHTGGAHGMPGRGFINFDREQDRELKLADVLLPGKEGAFWRVAAKAHQQWLLANEHDAAFSRQWPFQQTSNVALLRDNILLKYDVYSIAPYSSGHPELEIPYNELSGILKPAFLP
ncbi:RsiV family protein [Stutzerimonas zhaodongensis]|uniref:RsiV family protein n=1 Tax=Stutzerimonas TaxID=2901164 RepID=UPI00388FB936